MHRERESWRYFPVKKPWSGRFRQRTSESVEAFTESISYDKRLWKHDINGSIAHAKMLAKQGIIPARDAESIIKGLKEIATEIKSGKFRFSSQLEDIHMNIEAALAKKTGPAGKRLHTARSRNDQVALDLRLYLKEVMGELISLIIKLQKTLLLLAEEHISTMMPGYTHLQRAQPVLLSHHILAYVTMLQRDRNRFEDCMKRTDVLPLGSCAISGTTLPTDRQFLAKELEFREISGNSIDAVSDRDFAIEFLGCSSIAMMHLSRFAEEIVLWSTEEFGFVELSDTFTTGSSIMPQKKNPDVAELIRGKTGRIFGNLIALLTVMKGLPLSYNRDLQEDKLPVFDTADTLRACLSVLNEMLSEMRFDVKRMRSTAGEGYSTATDIAEYLVKKNIPFREAHEITGKIVLYCIAGEKSLDSLSLSEFRSFSPVISKDIFTLLDPAVSIKSRSSFGGTSPSEVRRQIKLFKKILS
ncbi:MAG: argininosuccinate lyase [Nitrospirae bacterium]|nr:argininosuccinate lyase [Nitrospirota bacterium]